MTVLGSLQGTKSPKERGVRSLTVAKRLSLRENTHMTHPKCRSISKDSRSTNAPPGWAIACTSSHRPNDASAAPSTNSRTPSTTHQRRQSLWSDQRTGTQSKCDNIPNRRHRLCTNPHPSTPEGSLQSRGVVDTQKITGSLFGIRSRTIPITPVTLRESAYGAILPSV